MAYDCVVPRVPPRMHASGPNRGDEYRKRAEEVRTKAEAMDDQRARDSLLRDADMWERMAKWEDENNPPPRGSN
jgi:aminoglycoside phosphotransferase (APT) family kinase protein